MQTSLPVMKRPSSLTSRSTTFATELEVARAATELFAQQCIEATTVESIADQTGISLRTFYCYFPTQEQSVPHYWQVGTETCQ
ncbi:TetR family transcriptional regulator [Arthrobacter sp. S41]|nr:TetR family transcriptional regulator [Arthrobacter sp. S41]